MRSADRGAPWAGPEARARPEAIRTQTCKARKNRRSRAGADWQRSSKECATLRPAVERDRKSTRLNPVTNAHLVCRLLLEKKNNKYFECKTNKNLYTDNKEKE